MSRITFILAGGGGRERVGLEEPRELEAVVASTEGVFGRVLAAPLSPLVAVLTGVGGAGTANTLSSELFAGREPEEGSTALSAGFDTGFDPPLPTTATRKSRLRLEGAGAST